MEHIKDFLQNNGESNYAKPLIDVNRNFVDDFLHVQSKGHKLKYLESLEINRLKHSSVLLNDLLDLNTSSLLNLFSKTRCRIVWDSHLSVK